ncbi:MAG TPA: LppX_LprAFG lipoprotein [Kineosporiaceae bacterium]|nr:LppX_LprAFG lipoprotein [Kineosporiaceae bacterium]
MRRPRAALRTLLTTGLALALAAGGLAACTRSGSPKAAASSTPDPAAVLAGAKKQLDAAAAVHFTLSSPSTPSGGTALLGGEGDIVRPDRFKGGLDVVLDGLKAHVNVVSVGGTVWVQLLGSGWSTVQPEQIGLRDPATFIAPQGGLADLLTKAQNPSFTGEKRRGSEVLRQIRATIPGETVRSLLTSVDPSQPVPAVLGVDEATGQLREATLTGPFFDAKAPSTYTVVLDRYGEKVEIGAPSA